MLGHLMDRHRCWIDCSLGSADWTDALVDTIHWIGIEFNASAMHHQSDAVRIAAILLVIRVIDKERKRENKRLTSDLSSGTQLMNWRSKGIRWIIIKIT